MDIKNLNTKWLSLALVLLSLAAISGCCCEAYPLPGECDCPTDARRLYFSTGEEAVRRCPCGPDREYYGLKPTCWRRWPDGWGCGQCDHPSLPDGSCGGVGEGPAFSGADGSNPFRSKEWEDEHSTPAVEATSPPARVPPAVTAPAQAAPAQSAPPELFPLEKALPANTPVPHAPVTPQKPATSNPPVQGPASPPATIKSIPPQTPKLEAPPARITPLQPPPTQSAPTLKPPAGASATKRKKVVAQHKPAPAIGEKTTHIVQPATLHVPVPQSPAPQPVESPLSNRVEQHLTNNLSM